jgi:hypothetical protein
VDIDQFAANIWVVCSELSKLAHISGGQFILANTYKPTWGFETEQGQDQDNACEDYVQNRSVYPLLGAVVGDVEGRSPVGLDNVSFRVLAKLQTNLRNIQA